MKLPFSSRTVRSMAVADEFAEGHAHVGPVDGAEVQDPAQVDGAGGRAAQLADHALDRLAGQAVVDLLVAGLEVQAGLAAVDEDLQPGPQEHVDGVLVAAAELADGAFHAAVAGRRDAQEGETFDRGNAGVLDYEIGHDSLAVL